MTLFSWSGIPQCLESIYYYTCGCKSIKKNRQLQAMAVSFSTCSSNHQHYSAIKTPQILVSIIRGMVFHLWVYSFSFKKTRQQKNTMNINCPMSEILFPQTSTNGTEEIIHWEVLKCNWSSKRFCYMSGGQAFAETAPPVADKLRKQEETHAFSIWLHSMT